MNSIDPRIDLASLVVRKAVVAEIIDLRHIVLRAGLPREEAIFAGDELPESRHVLAEAAGRVVGCATLHANFWEGEPAWQLRGMAVANEFRGAGIGQKLLGFLEDWVRSTSATHLWWCNARTPALRFYQRQGWDVMSEVFHIPTAGPHVRMIKRLRA